MVLAVSGGEVSVVYARSGCCSGHGGVCGCSCCDSSRLSSVCLPHYPECEVTTNEHDRTEMKPNKNGSILSDRSKLKQNEKGNNWLGGWSLAVVYAIGVCLVLFFC